LSRPELRAGTVTRARRRAAVGLVLAVATLLVLFGSGCGKSNLRRASAAASPSVVHKVVRAKRSPPVPKVPVPKPLTAGLAGSFSRAVELTQADLPGTHVEPRAKRSEPQEKEASRCGGSPAVAVGGGRSAKLERGLGLERENFSSSVEVLSSAKAVKSDLAYAQSRAGLACYERVLRHTLSEEHHGQVRIEGVHLARVSVAVAGRREGAGIRIVARVGTAATNLSVLLFVDAISFAYGPAEIDLYTTSFIQPVPVKTEQELLTLMRERASLQTL
jgi:hypothetical protein